MAAGASIAASSAVDGGKEHAVRGARKRVLPNAPRNFLRNQDSPAYFSTCACIQGTPDRRWEPMPVPRVAQGFRTSTFGAAAALDFRINNLRGGGSVGSALDSLDRANVAYSCCTCCSCTTAENRLSGRRSEMPAWRTRRRAARSSSSSSRSAARSRSHSRRPPPFSAHTRHAHDTVSPPLLAFASSVRPATLGST